MNIKNIFLLLILTNSSQLIFSDSESDTNDEDVLKLDEDEIEEEEKLFNTEAEKQEFLNYYLNFFITFCDDILNVLPINLKFTKNEITRIKNSCKNALSIEDIELLQKTLCANYAIIMLLLNVLNHKKLYILKDLNLAWNLFILTTHQFFNTLKDKYENDDNFKKFLLKLLKRNEMLPKNVIREILTYNK